MNKIRRQSAWVFLLIGRGMTPSRPSPNPTGALISHVNPYFKSNNYINDEYWQIATYLTYIWEDAMTGVT